MLIVVLASALLIALTTAIHYEVLRAIYTTMPSFGVSNRHKVLLVSFGLLAAHFLEIAVYGAGFYLLVRYLDVGTLAGANQFSLESCLYFSSETYTSLGFGDIRPVGPLRLLAGVEALNGLLLIGWSASFAYLAMERFWSKEDTDKRPPPA